LRVALGHIVEPPKKEPRKLEIKLNTEPAKVELGR